MPLGQTYLPIYPLLTHPVGYPYSNDKLHSIHPEVPNDRRLHFHVTPRLNRWKKTYNEGETCVYKGYKFKAKSQVQGVVPVSKVYDSQPYLMGFHNSLLRVKLWMDERIKTLDNKYNYNLK